MTRVDGEVLANSTRLLAADYASVRRSIVTSDFRWRERFMFARKTGWPVIAAAIAALVLSACTQTGTGTQSPTTQPSARPVSKVLSMARQAAAFSPFGPWQIDDYPSLVISAQVY